MNEGRTVFAQLLDFLPKLAQQPFGLIILDPAYKVLGNRDENANGEIADLMNEFEALPGRLVPRRCRAPASLLRFTMTRHGWPFATARAIRTR
jgi:hypothetical protein